LRHGGEEMQPVTALGFSSLTAWYSDAAMTGVVSDARTLS
jgi:hypothetical protein